MNWVPPTKQSLTKRLASSKKLHSTESQLLLVATKGSHLEMIAVLASYSEQWIRDQCLRAAVDGDDSAATQLLLRYGADANTLEPEFPFCKAVEKRKLEIVRLILNAPKALAAECISKALLPAVDIGNVSLVLHFLQKGATIRSKILPLSDGLSDEPFKFRIWK